MKWPGLLTLTAALMTLGAATLHAQSTVGALVQRLEGGPDTRTRVQAALSLGGLRGPEARAALERALERDPRTAVRAAAASALGALGDHRALGVLGRQADHPSLAVRQRVEEALQQLRRGDASGKLNVLVELGALQRGKTKVPRALAKALQRASRDGLGALSGVQMVDAERPTGDREVPLVRVTGSLKTLKTSRADGKLVCSARVEYVLHRMPGQVIAAVVSGSAKTAVAEDVLNNREALGKLRRQAVEAAVASALRRAPKALLKVASQ